MQNVINIGQQRAADSLRMWLIMNNFTTRSLTYAMNIRAMNVDLVRPLPEPNTNRIIRDMETLCNRNPTEPYAWGDKVPALRFLSVTIPTGGVTDVQMEVISEQVRVATHNIIQQLATPQGSDRSIQIPPVPIADGDTRTPLIECPGDHIDQAGPSGFSPLQGQQLNINAPAFISPHTHTHTHTSPQEVIREEIIAVKPVVKKPKIKPVRAMVSAPLGSKSWLRPDKMFLALEDKIELIVHRYTPPQKAPKLITEIIHSLHNIRPGDQPVNFEDLDSSDSSNKTPAVSQNSSETSSVHHSVSRTPISHTQDLSPIIHTVESSQPTQVVPLTPADILPVVVSQEGNVESQTDQVNDNEQEDDRLI
eukprot:GHVR01180397.1.p1 GENE.GHVR01180397.1~~GHVR01180397.1.p1  ORF type:complete len:364 (-),score=46.42 GHVR01180397.1:1242-2333(-)